MNGEKRSVKVVGNANTNILWEVVKLKQKLYMLMSLCIRNLLQESYNFQSIIDLLFTNDNFMQNRFLKLSVDESKSIYTIWANKADIAMKY